MSKAYVVFCMDTEGPCDDPDNDSLLKTWKDVDHAMDKLFDRKYRFKYKDSMGNGLKIGWFYLTWTGVVASAPGNLTDLMPWNGTVLHFGITPWIKSRLNILKKPEI